MTTGFQSRNIFLVQDMEKGLSEGFTACFCLVFGIALTLIRSGLFLLMSCSSTKKKLRCVVCDNKQIVVEWPLSDNEQTVVEWSLSENEQKTI
jgi:hypothetical protein